MQVNGITPTQGKVGSRAKISGQGFTKMQAHSEGMHRVRIGGMEPEITGWSENAIDIIIPKLGTGPKEVSVSLAGDSGPGPNPAKPAVIFQVIEGVEPSLAAPRSVVTPTGPNQQSVKPVPATPGSPTPTNQPPTPQTPTKAS